ncbi:MAG TPA: SpoIIE family protein phosphatase, partial [bacterium]|nr:SpoIIE family protein phosphatase [bacterium]
MPFENVNKIVVVDDEQPITMLIKILLSKQGIDDVVTFNESIKAKEYIFETKPDIVCTDIKMPQMNGIELLNEIKTNLPDTLVIMISATSEFEDVLSCLKLGAYDFITKPIKKDGLTNVINKATEIISLRKKNKLYVEELAQKNRVLTEFNNKMKNELKLAQDLQMKFTPNLSRKFGNYNIQFSRKYSSQIGGDFITSYDFEDSAKFAIILADMPGHGIPAALVSTAFKVLCLDALRSEKSSGEILSQINENFLNLNLNLYPSVCCLVIDKENKIIEYSNAGHPYPFIISADKTIQTIEQNEILLGVMNYNYATQQIKLKPKDTIYLYSDGLIEIQQSALNNISKPEISRDDEDEYNILNLAEFLIE